MKSILISLPTPEGFALEPQEPNMDFLGHQANG
jgi:hypothetical protein